MQSSIIFENRKEAGRTLAEKLQKYKDDPNAVILALPRGGVPVAYELSVALNLPLDVFVVRKLGVPGQVELAMGAIASGGVRVLNEDIIQTLNIADPVIAAVAAQEQRELERRELIYRRGRPSLKAAGHTVILVDDGLATGATMKAAIAALRSMKTARIVVAVPVAAASTCEELKRLVDEIVCARTPEPFFGVGYWYSDFPQISDEEVSTLLENTDRAENSRHQQRED
jgi:putative phosphoribosyl transferase